MSFEEGTSANLVAPVELLCRLSTDQEFECPRKHGDEVVSCAWAPDGSSFAWSLGTGMVFVMQIESEEGRRNSNSYDLLKNTQAVREKKCLDCSHRVTAVAFGCRSSDKKWHSGQVSYNRLQNYHRGNIVLAAGLANGDIKIWDVVSGRIMLVLQDHKGAITDLSFSPDGSLVLASASQDGKVKLWDLMDDGNMFQTFNGHCKAVKAVAWSPNTQQIVSVGAGRNALMWCARTGVLRHRLDGHQNDVTGCQFSPDGALIYTSSLDTKVICWDTSTGQRKTTFSHMYPNPRPIFAGGVNGHEVLSVTVSQDGSHIASICNDGYLRIWNIFSSTLPMQVTAVSDARTVKFSHESYLLAVGVQSGTLEFFQAPMEICGLQRACRLAIRSVTNGKHCQVLNLPKKMHAYLNYSDVVH